MPLDRTMRLDWEEDGVQSRRELASWPSRDRAPRPQACVFPLRSTHLRVNDKARNSMNNRTDMNTRTLQRLGRHRFADPPHREAKSNGGDADHRVVSRMANDRSFVLLVRELPASSYIPRMSGGREGAGPGPMPRRPMNET